MKRNRNEDGSKISWNRRTIRRMQRTFIPAFAVIIVGSVLFAGGFSPIANASEPATSENEVWTETEESGEYSAELLLGGAAVDTEVFTYAVVARDMPADYLLPVAGAADELVMDDDQIMQVDTGISEEEVVVVEEEEEQEAAAAEEQMVAVAYNMDEDDYYYDEDYDYEEVNEYENFAIADVNYDFINVRGGAGTNYEVVGKMYDKSVAQIIDQEECADGLWFHVTSGNVEGYIKAEYFIYGDQVESLIDESILRYASVRVNCLNIRKEATVDSDQIGYLTVGERVLILEDEGDWFKVQYTDEKTGYIAAEYVNIEEEYISAKSIEEEKKELEEKKKKEEREKQQSVQSVQEDVTFAVAAPSANYSTNMDLRNAIVAYAMQFVGNRYVPAGQSLSGGTDCSGFTCYVYRDFGYSISRTPSGQMAGAGRSISLAEAQPGDIICYGSGGCSHVAMYIGNGQIVHEANSRMGCIVSGIDFMNVVGVKNVID